MNHQEWLERAEIYALGALDGAELSRFQAHLAAGCGSCERRITETREALTALPRSLPLLEPPASAREKVLARIDVAAERQPTRPRVEWRWWTAGAGALVAASLLVALAWGIYTTRQELVQLEQRVATLQDELAQREELLHLLADPRVRIVKLTGLDPSPKATGQLFWNPATGTGIFFANGLPPAPPEKAYELWAIAGSEPVPAGVFTVDQAGRGILKLQPLTKAKSFNKFAVTLEPAVGVSKPTGPMHLLGSFWAGQVTSN